MENEQLAIALVDLVQAIEAIMLGSIQANVIEEAGKTLINSWNDHHDEKINTVNEMYNWNNRLSNERSSIIRDSVPVRVVKTIDFMLEMLETKLELFNGKPVILVIPSFGSQSSSRTGDLWLYDTTTYPVKFQVSSNGMATIFTAEDIKSTKLVENRTEHSPQLIIELKGPKDYPAA